MSKWKKRYRKLEGRVRGLEDCLADMATTPAPAMVCTDARIEPSGPGPAIRVGPGWLRIPGYTDLLVDIPIHLALELSHPINPRIDVLYVRGNQLAVATGKPDRLAMPAPWPIGSHFVANILVRAGALTLLPRDIHTDPHEAFTW